MDSVLYRYLLLIMFYKDIREQKMLVVKSLKVGAYLMIFDLFAYK